MLYKMILTFESGKNAKNKRFSFKRKLLVDFSFCFVCHALQRGSTFDSVDKILNCCQLNETVGRSYFAVVMFILL